MHHLEGILWSIAIGGIAGWLAGWLQRGRGYGLIWNIIFGIVGGALANVLLGLLALAGIVVIPATLLGRLIAATAGAWLLLYLLRRHRLLQPPR